MNILFIGVGNPIPSFIKRRLEALAGTSVKLTIVAEFGQRIEGLKDFNILRAGGKLGMFQQMLLFAKALLLPHLLIRLVKCRPELGFSQRLKWAVKYLSLARAAAPDIVHFQWLALVLEFHWLRNYFDCPFIGSARGSQVTVYPLTLVGHKSSIIKAIQIVDFIHCVSNDISTACERLGASKEKLFVNYNGINIQEFVPRKIARDSGVFTVISVGGMMWRKGLLYQLQILKRLCLEKREVQLLWVGDGPDRDGLYYTAQVLGIADRLIFAGQLNASELPDMLNKADVFLSTSLAEGLANSVVEAVSSGLPVVAFACEGMEEILGEGNAGFILSPGDCDKAADKIGYLMDNPEVRVKMGHYARDIAVRKFDQTEWVSRMIKTYQEIEKKQNNPIPAIAFESPK